MSYLIVSICRLLAYGPNDRGSSYPLIRRSIDCRSRVGVGFSQPVNAGSDKLTSSGYTAWLERQQDNKEEPKRQAKASRFAVNKKEKL
jgi:hypothetical protein